MKIIFDNILNFKYLPPKAIVFIGLLFLHSAPSFAQPQASFSIVNATGCVPLNVQFSNTSTGASSWFWDFGDGNTSVLQNPANIYLSPGSYTVKLVAYDAGGNADSLIQSQAVTVINKPSPSFTSNVTLACQGNNPVQFTNTSSFFDSCLWDFGDGITSGLNNPVHLYTTPGTFSVTLICFNTVSGCSESFTIPGYITIHPKPTATVTANMTSTCDSIQPFIFSAVAPNATAFHWNFGDNSTSNIQNPTHIYNAAGLYTVTLITTSQQGCKDTLVMNNYVEVKSNPVPPMFLSDSSGCVPFWVNCSTAGTFSYCLWTFGDGDSSYSTGINHPYQNSGTYPIQLTVTYTNGCTNSNNYNNIQALVTPLVSISLLNFEGCRPLTVQCINTSTNGSLYSWDFGDNTTSSAIAPSHTYNQNGWFNIRLTVTNTNGCSAISQPYTVKVKGPGADIFADVTGGCPPLVVNFTANPISQTSYYWNFGDGTTSTLANPQHTYTNIGNYNVILAVTNVWGCTDTINTPVLIQVANQASNFVAPPPVTGCAPLAVNLSDNTPGASQWSWDFGDGTTGSGQSVTHTFLTPGTYVVSLNTGAASGGCPMEIPVFSTFIVGGGIPNFTYTQSLCPPYTANFLDSSTNAVAWLWDFGDGTTSSLQNPNHVYTNPGVYNVSLTITTPDGCSISCIHNYALHFSTLISYASAFTADTALPMTVNFNANTTGATWWLWNFGDSTTSSLENPTHIYTTPGPYAISLTIGNDSCSYTYTYPPTNLGVGSGGIPSNPDSVHTPLPHYGCAPMAVNFHNPFINTTSWLWNFGDGNNSTQPNPVYVYQQPGIYDVTLYATHANGAVDSLIQPSGVDVIGGVNADFLMTHSNSCTGTTVSLAALDSTIIQYNWSFGDSSHSSLANPVHTYPNNGSNYIISLMAYDSSGCNDFVMQSFYTSNGIPLHPSKKKACGYDSIYFDSGSLLYSNYVWHFGDGDSSMLPNAWHTYGDTGTYMVTLTVTDTSGCSQNITLSDPVVIYNPLADFSMTFSQHCVGLDVTFTNLSTNADAFLWDFGDGTTSTSINTTHFYNMPGSYFVSLTAFKNNCSHTYTLPNPVLVPNTTIDFSYTQDGQCFPITITCSDLSTDVNSWLWEFGDGTTSTLQNPIHTFTSVPSGDIILHITNANGCILVKNLPNITVTAPFFALSDTSGCAPASISFLDSSVNASSWFWNFGDGQTSTLQFPQHTYQQEGYYSVTLIVQATTGCVDTLQIDSLVQVTSIASNFTNNINSGCAPVIIDFTDLSLHAISWNWNFGDGSSSQQQSPTHIYTTPGIYDVSLTVMNSEGCMDSMTIQNRIEVNGPISGFFFSGSNGCSPVSIQFTDTSILAVTWQWNFGDGSTSSSVNPAHTYTQAGQFIVSLTTEDSLGCQAIITSPDTISVNLAPVASFIVSDTVGCAPHSITFSSQSTGYDSLYWHFGDGNTMTSTSSITYTYTVPGIFYPYLVAYSNAGCADTFYLNRPVSIGLKPLVDFTSNIIRGCAPLIVSFNDLSSSLTNASNYLWNFGNGDTSNSVNPMYTFHVPGIYTITLTVTNEGGCTSGITKQALIQVFDSNPPPASPILRVTVVSDSEVEITWQNSATLDLSAYIVYRLNAVTGIFDPIYTDSNPNNSGINPVTLYTDRSLNTLQHTYSYKIQTIDLCEHALPLDSLVAHTTINITAQNMGKNIHVSWTPYGGCTVNQYDIYRNDPSNGSFNKIASVPSGSTDYLDTLLLCPELYAYRVTATDLCGNTYSSDSDTSMAQPDNALNDQHVEVTRTTVIDDQNTLTEWKPPLLAPDQVVAYNIYRSETENGNYDLISSVGSNVLNFMDQSTHVHLQNYFYKVEVINRCNAQTLMNTLGSSILLLASPDHASTRLIWTAYKGWDSGVMQYIIEKQKPDGSWETIQVVDGNTLQTEIK